MRNDLIGKIRELKKIEPSQEWLVSARNDLMAGIEPDISFFQWLRQPQQFALVACLILIFLGGPWLALKASEASLPGDLLYSVKKANEGLQMTITSENNKTQLKMEFASRRLEELAKVSEDSGKTNKVKGIASDLKNNLKEASVYADKISETEIIAVAKKTQEIKEELSMAAGEASLDVQDELAQAGEVVEEINKILTVLNTRYQEDRQDTSTSTDQEILIFLQELEDGTITTTDKVINGVEESN